VLFHCLDVGLWISAGSADLRVDVLDAARPEAESALPQPWTVVRFPTVTDNVRRTLDERDDRLLRPLRALPEPGAAAGEDGDGEQYGSCRPENGDGFPPS
jgi:hypothetical protein